MSLRKKLTICFIHSYAVCIGDFTYSRGQSISSTKKKTKLLNTKTRIYGFHFARVSLLKRESGEERNENAGGKWEKHGWNGCAIRVKTCKLEEAF